MTPEVL